VLYLLASLVRGAPIWRYIPRAVRPRIGSSEFTWDIFRGGALLASSPSKRVLDNLASALQALADVLGVALSLRETMGGNLTEWQYPVGVSTEHAPLRAPDSGTYRQDTGLAGDEHAVILDLGNKTRCFVISLGAIEGLGMHVRSGPLPEHFAWTDGMLKCQDFPGCEFSMTDDPKFLLWLFIHTVCHTVAEKAATQDLDDLDAENIRRIGMSLFKRIDCPQDTCRPPAVSLEGVPGLDRFFKHTSSASGSVPTNDLSTIFNTSAGGEASPVACSYNLMSLSGDFLVKTANLCSACHDYVRRQHGTDCFASDIRCLIQAALGRKQEMAFATRCHAGFLEIFAPVFVEELVVGLVFGGQIVTSESERIEIEKKYSVPADKNITWYVMGNEHRDVIRSIVSVLANLIGRLSDEYCIERNQAHILEELVRVPVSDARGIFAKACAVVKQLLAVSECSAFSLTRSNTLVLEATTAREIRIRDIPKGPIQRTIPAEDAIGRVFYRVGEGLTGSAIERGESVYQRHAEQCSEWFGRCVEGKEPAQVFLVPIRHEDRAYGVLRAVKPARIDQIPEPFRNLIELVGGHVGILLHNHELTEIQTDELKATAGHLQDLLAEVAHEYRSPIHNVLSLSTAIPYAQDPDVLRAIHQELKEEVYRAKRIMDNYLLHGLEGRAHQQYNMCDHSLNELVRQVVSRFTRMAAKKGLVIRVPIGFLPNIKFDKDRIDQLLSNLLDNAVKYAFNDYEDRCGILITAKDKTNTVTISIKDMGLGIPRELQESIFKGYARSVEDPTCFKPGTGLGLKIAKTIAERHGGSISVHSEPFWSDPQRLAKNEGFWTTFTVSLLKR
jgi:signal transduction histidine kinase